MARSSVAATAATLGLEPAQLVCGHEHGALLMQNGVVYTFGGPTPDFGQLARAVAVKAKRMAILVEQLVDHTIIQLAAGENHCLALGEKGDLWAWGKNTSGQLGPIQDRDSAHLLHTPQEESPLKLSKADFAPEGGKKSGTVIRAIGAGRHSSAAVTSAGELFVWGELGARFRDRAKTKTPWLVSRELNPCRPLLVKPPVGEEASEQLGGDDEVGITCLAQPIMNRDELLCTVLHRDQLENLDDLGDNDKARINELRVESRKLRKRHETQEREEKEFKARENEFSGIEPFKDMHLEMEGHKVKLKNEVEECMAAIQEKKELLRRIVRQIAVIDQHDVQNLAQFERLEAELSSFAKMPGDRPSSQAHQLTTQLNDIRLFREVNRKQKFNLLSQKSELTSTLMSLESKKNLSFQTLLIFEEREKLMRRLATAPKAGDAAEVEDKVKTTCDMKTNCIRDADLQTISGQPHEYSGLSEALLISSRTLGDVLSSLREVSMASMGTNNQDITLFENSIEYQCTLVHQIDNRVKDAMNRATDMMHFFHGEMSSNFEDLPVTTR
jgi:hypothetical protein